MTTQAVNVEISEKPSKEVVDAPPKTEAKDSQQEKVIEPVYIESAPLVLPSKPAVNSKPKQRTFLDIQKKQEPEPEIVKPDVEEEIQEPVEVQDAAAPTPDYDNHYDSVLVSELLKPA